ncbi:MAG: hypothetical protein H0W68_03940 [Gemmatimonadaceae bacterium]|nr:hypothetical protein [Gemmatimonadaceae bacterium]
MKELGAAVDAAATTAAQPSPASGTGQAVGPQGGPSNPRLLPDFSAVGDLLGDLSPQGSSQTDRSRFGVREVEIAVQAIVDPYFRGDIFLGFNDAEGVAIEQAFLTTTSLPNELELKLGRFLMPFGKQNLTHRHDLHTIEYPYVIQRLFSDDGVRGTGLWGNRVFAPFGFFQEVQLTAVDRLGEPTEGLTPREDANRSLAGLGFSARLRNYFDISEAANVELSFSALTARRAQPLDGSITLDVDRVGGGRERLDVNAVNARQSTFGADLTYRWRPLQQGIYESFILQAEVMRQTNERAPPLPSRSVAYTGPTRDYTGAYVFARYQTSQRSYLGSRYDYVQDPERDGRTLNAGSVYLEWYPSEFTKLLAGYEALRRADDGVRNRLLIQAVFSLGPHKPHPF